MSTLRVEYVKVGDRLVPVAVPNDIIPAETFYVSYNDVDLDLFGGATTALVLYTKRGNLVAYDYGY